MRVLLAALALTLAGSAAAMGLDTETQAAIARYKPGKLVAIEDVAQFMRASEQWCYHNQDHSCAWTDIYLEVSETGVTYEIGNAWDAETDVAFTDHGEFRDGRYICETGYDWVPTVRATRRSDGSAIGGRLLAELKDEIYGNREGDTQDCFDYLYRAFDPDQEVVTLLQRQYVGGEHLPDADTEVTLHFNAEDAAGLTWRW
ncbi:hypothetical protein [Devosia sp.]|uniref:hypothetical protein n=1 Tax=Devosia sp. TaxID=1871048 RepID=UPI002FC86F39